MTTATPNASLGRESPNTTSADNVDAKAKAKTALESKKEKKKRKKKNKQKKDNNNNNNNQTRYRELIIYIIMEGITTPSPPRFDRTDVIRF